MSVLYVGELCSDVILSGNRQLVGYRALKFFMYLINSYLCI